MTDTELIAGILQREGGFRDKAGDNGHATNFGITAASWGGFKHLGRPATRAEIQAITRDQAVEFYRAAYLTHSPFRSIAYEPLRVQLIDFGVNSGTTRALRWLQRVLDVPVTGVFDDRTQGGLTRDRGPLVNRGLTAARLYMLEHAVDHGDTPKSDENGLEHRALSFAEFTI